MEPYFAGNNLTINTKKTINEKYKVQLLFMF